MVIRDEILDVILKEIKNGKYNEIQYNSKLICEGDIFVALEGHTVDGHDYIEQAIKNGAKVILHSKRIEEKPEIKYYLVDDLRKKLGFIASEFYGWPQKELKIIGITGTNGKTTTTYLIEHILGNENVSRIGTVEYKIGKEIIEAPNTTPESLDIIKMCKKSLERGMRYLVMEVSSHALILGRVDMLEFDVAIFSNLTPEHLDFHKDMEDYFMAKREIFKKVKKDGSSIINIDDNYGVRYFNEFTGIDYGIGNGKLKGEYLDGDHTKVKFTFGESNQSTVKIKLLGRYNLYNILSAIGAGLVLGYSWEYIMERVTTMSGAPGRFEIIDCGQNYTAIVDYAHSPDALENLLKTVKELNFNKIITVFGCGGDRDKTKRPIMAKISKQYSDITIITADNPRTEKIENIIEDMLVDLDKENLIVESNREEAIKIAIKIAEKNNIIVVAGKGHEAYQIIGKEKYHFDDREYLRKEIIRKMEGK